MTGRINESIENSDLKVDLKDRKIISILSQNCRAPLSKVASKVKLSRDAVDYRIKRMSDAGLILGFAPLFTFRMFGLRIFHTFIVFKNNKKERCAEFIEYLKNCPQIRTVLEYSGRWDLEIGLLAKDINEFDDLITDITSKFTDIIAEKAKMEVIKIYNSILIPHFFHEDTLGVINSPYQDIDVYGNLDEKDMKILEILCDDGRISTYKIANEIGLSADAVSYRIKKMVNSKYIQAFTVMLNLTKLKYQWYTFAVQTKTLDREHEAKLKQFIQNNSYIIRAVKTLGTWDLLLYVVVDTPYNYHETIKEFRDEFADIINYYQTWMLYKEHIYNPYPYLFSGSEQRKKVLVFGSFDVLHPGHLNFFRESKKQGTHLTVLVAKNKSIKATKGKNPKYNEEDRLAHVKELSIVDEALLGSSKNYYDVLSKVKPAIICLGYDQEVDVDKLKMKIKDLSLKTKVIRLKPFKAKKYKSSKLKLQMEEKDY